MAERICTVPACERQHYAKGYCHPHYEQVIANPRRQGKARKRTYIEVPCATCGTMVRKLPTSERPNRFCSPKCRADWQFGEHRPANRVDNPLLPAIWKPPKARRRRRGNQPRWTQRVWLAGNCAWCATPFVIVDQLHTKYCSDQCVRQARRAAHGRFAVPPQIRLAIYKRDKWICQLCHEPVDPTLHQSNRWAATLDHIECQSWALIPDHSARNLRLAHRWCNSIRGDETYQLTSGG